MRLRRAAAPVPDAPERHDALLAGAYGEELDRLDAECAAGPVAPARFRELDDDLWGLLLTQCYEGWPHLRAALPGVPEPEWQRLWNGRSGAALAEQSVGFYRMLRAAADVHLDGGLAEARVLDFGCGWGRLTRLLARDVADDRLYGCDPVQGILDVCVRERVPAHFARNEVRSGRLPFDERFDLAFAFSVFTHLSEPAHEHALDALHAGLRPGGVLVVTVRPDDFLDGEAQYRFVAHPADAGHLQYQGGEMEYGESVVTLPYVRERWAPRFTLLKASLQLADLQQVVLVLRREGTP